MSESKRAWSGQVVVKEKLASGSTCATTLKLAVDVNGDFKGSERDRFILQGLSDAREFSEVRASRDFPEDIVRVCVGVEDPRDLVADFEQAFASYRSFSLGGMKITSPI